MLMVRKRISTTKMMIDIDGEEEDLDDEDDD